MQAGLHLRNPEISCEDVSVLSVIDSFNVVDLASKQTGRVAKGKTVDKEKPTL